MSTVLRITLRPTGQKARCKAPKNRTSISDLPVSEPIRVHARAVKRIFNRETGELVGWLYEWNTGCLVPRWKSKPHEDVVYE